MGLEELLTMGGETGLDASGTDIGGDITPQQKYSIMLSSLIPLALAAIKGGRGSLQAGAEGGMLAGQLGLKDAQSQAKTRQTLSIFGAKSALEEKKDIAKEGRKFEKDKELLDLKMDATDKQFDARRNRILADSKALTDYRKQVGDGKDGVPAPKFLIDSYNKARLYIKGMGGPELAEMPETATQKQLASGIGLLEQVRVPTTFQKKEEGKTAEAEVFGHPNLSNPEGELFGAKYTPDQKKKLTGLNTFTPQVMRYARELEDLMDEKKTGVPQDAFTNPVTIDATKLPPELRDRAATIVQRRVSLLSNLISSVKNLQNMGANFTEYEQRLVRAILGADAPDVTDTASILRALTGSQIGLRDFQRGIQDFQNDTSNYYFEVLKANNAGFDVDTLMGQATSRDFLGRLYRTKDGRRLMDSFRK